jgi:hypothetical protein
LSTSPKLWDPHQVLCHMCSSRAGVSLDPAANVLWLARQSLLVALTPKATKKTKPRQLSAQRKAKPHHLPAKPHFATQYGDVRYRYKHVAWLCKQSGACLSGLVNLDLEKFPSFTCGHRETTISICFAASVKPRTIKFFFQSGVRMGKCKDPGVHWTRRFTEAEVKGK